MIYQWLIIHHFLFSTQIFQLDQDAFDHLSTENYDDPPDPDKMTDLTSLESYEQSLPNALRRLNKKKPLPDIPGLEFESLKKLIASYFNNI